MNKDIKNIDQYVSQFPSEVQSKLEKIRAIIKERAPSAEETINYGMPTFKLNGNLVHFAAYKNHIGFYPTPSGIEKFKNEIEKYEYSKGAVKFPITEDIPYNLIKKIVEFRVKENLSKKK